MVVRAHAWQGSRGFAPGFGGVKHFAAGLVLGEAGLDKPPEQILKHPVPFLAGR
jgi:hypothetical protein